MDFVASKTFTTNVCLSYLYVIINFLDVSKKNFMKYISIQQLISTTFNTTARLTDKYLKQNQPIIFPVLEIFF